jgi:outer membrane immunogenic protein
MKKIILAVAALSAFATANAASAADMAYKAAPMAAPVAYDWTGFYIGGDVGNRWTKSDFLLTNTTGLAAFTAAGATSVPFDTSAFRGGIFTGYNWQVAPQWVVGLEGDVGWANSGVTHDGFIPGAPLANPALSQAGESRSFSSKWDASIRGRVGVLLIPQVLLYGTGGVAWQHFNTSAFCNNFQANANLTVCGDIGAPSQTITNSATRTGWTLGGGVEAMVWQHWFVRAEYRFADFGRASLTDTISVPASNATIGFVHDIPLKTQTALFGVGYKF